jgi:hypothetical protein
MDQYFRFTPFPRRSAEASPVTDQYAPYAAVSVRSQLFPRLSAFSQKAVIRDVAVKVLLRRPENGRFVHEYNATDLKGYSSGSVGIITYRWQLDRTVDRERHSGSGRDILVLEPATGSLRGVINLSASTRELISPTTGAATDSSPRTGQRSFSGSPPRRVRS